MLLLLPTIARRATTSVICRRFYHNSIPFDTKPFPFTRFEPCCPSTTDATAPNGYIPCQNHPIPNVLGKKIDMTDDMTRAPTLRHLVACIGPDALEWSRSKVEAVDGILQTMQNAENIWLKTHTPTQQEDQLVLTTAAEKPSSSEAHKTDILLFPEFKKITTAPNTIDPNLYQVLSSIWQDPHKSLPNVEWQDIEADTVILVCTHARRDLRCGKIGPLIVDEFNRVIEQRSLQGKVEVWGTSHFGGHKWAGNLIIHQRGLGGQLYGNVRQCHVADIVDRHILHGKVIKEIWRGQVTPATV
ncbi:MAG: Sucrase/ferredoxin-like-domain-containing protein [Benjaminiella poitrasii]|nr:MAG: Sucrase/ferredoxin-like-domain-containing protein [Benjaminiella poitrasii]